MCGDLLIYPNYWDLEPPTLRSYRKCEILLKQFVEEPIIERASPKEHIRKSHKRRVAYGKGRSLRKWVEIPETVVNAS